MEAVRRALALGLARETQRMRATAAALAPSMDDEARLLSEGEIADSSSFAGTVVGTPEGGRFLKAGTMLPLREAIAIDPVDVVREGALVFAATGQPERINQRSGFYWMTRRRGIRGPTEPFDRRLVQAFEFGGLWVVVPRPGTGSLSPEPGISARRMLKTIQPRLMYTQARQLGIRRLGDLRGLVRQAARRVGRAAA